MQQQTNNQYENVTKNYLTTFDNSININKSNTLYENVKQEFYLDETFFIKKKITDKNDENNIMLPDSVELKYNSGNKSNDFYQTNTPIDIYYEQNEFFDNIQFNDQNQQQNYQNQFNNDFYFFDKNKFYSSYNKNFKKINNDFDGVVGRCCTPVDPLMLVDDKNLNNFSTLNSTSISTDITLDTTKTEIKTLPITTNLTNEV